MLVYCLFGPALTELIKTPHLSLDEGFFAFIGTIT